LVVLVSDDAKIGHASQSLKRQHQQNNKGIACQLPSL